MIFYFKTKPYKKYCISCNNYAKNMFVIMRIYSEDDNNIKENQVFFNAYNACDSHGVNSANTETLEVTISYFIKMFKKESHSGKQIDNRNKIDIEYLQSFLV